MNINHMSVQMDVVADAASDLTTYMAKYAGKLDPPDMIVIHALLLVQHLNAQKVPLFVGKALLDILNDMEEESRGDGTVN